MHSKWNQVTVFMKIHSFTGYQVASGLSYLDAGSEYAQKTGRPPHGLYCRCSWCSYEPRMSGEEEARATLPVKTLFSSQQSNMCPFYILACSGPPSSSAHSHSFLKAEQPNPHPSYQINPTTVTNNLLMIQTNNLPLLESLTLFFQFIPFLLLFSR